MKRMSLIFSLVVVASLLFCSQALAAVKAEAAVKAKAAEIGEMAEPELALPQQLSEAQVSEMQRLLTEKGYQGVSVNGILGDETMAAIRQFQDAEGLTVNGHPNAETLRALAPQASQQEFFGLSPEFGEEQK